MRGRIKNNASVGPATGFEEKLKVEKTEKNVHELWTIWTSGFGEFFSFLWYTRIYDFYPIYY